MERLPIMYQGAQVGELAVEHLAGDVGFSARCTGMGKGLWCLWVVGSTGELRLGVLEDRGREAVFSRRFSQRMTAPLGHLLRGELRSAGESRGSIWQSVSRPEALFRTPWLRRALTGAEGALIKKAGKGCFLALPYSPERPFPLTPLFCFCRICRIEQREYAVFCFDDAEWPVLS